MKLHEYQERARAFIRSHNRCILSVDMGLGKTAATLHAIAALSPETLLIVAPKRVAETVWLQEAEKWGLDAVASKMVIVAGDKAKRSKALADKSKPYKIISRDNLTDVKGGIYSMLVIDELTSFKTPSAARTKAVASIIAPRKVGLTGTFLANGAIDIYGQCVAVDMEERLGRNFYAWRASYFRDALKGSGLQWSKWRPAVPLETILAPIKSDIFTLSAADYLNIPPVSEVEHPVTLSEEERDAYDTVEAFLAGNIGGTSYAIGEDAKFAKLQTLCNGFVYATDKQVANKDASGVLHLDDELIVRAKVSTKLETVAEFCERCASEGEQVLLFYAYKEEARWLAEMLEARHVPYTHVGKKDALTKWSNHEAGVLFAHPASAGHGLNLQGGGRIVVWSSVTYNYEYFAQANARLARQGQTKAVQIHYFTARNTCEEAKRKALSSKAKEQGLFINLTK